MLSFFHPQHSSSSLRRNSLYLTIGGVLRFAASILSAPLLIRWLGLERFGAWAVLSSLPLLGGLLELGLPTAVSKRLSEDYARQNWSAIGQTLATSCLLITILGLLASTALFVTTPVMVNLLFHNASFSQDARLTLVILTAQLFLYFFQHWETAILGSLMRYDMQVTIETLGTLVTTIGILLVALMDGRLALMAVWSTSITAACVLAYAFFALSLWSQNSMHLRVSREGAIDLIRFGGWHWLSNLGSSLFGYLDRILVNYLLGPAAAGVYTAATSVTTKINQLSAMPLQALPIWISVANGLSQKSRVHEIFVRATRLNGAVVFLLTAPLMFWAQPIAQFLVGTAASGEVARLLWLLSGIYGLYSLAGAGFYSAIGLGSPKTNAIIGLAGGMLTIIGLVLLTPVFGLIGAAWANALYICVLLTNWRVMVLIDLRVKEYLAHFSPSVIALTVCAMLSSMLQSSPLTFWPRVVIFLMLGATGIISISGWSLLKEVVNEPVCIILKWKSEQV